MLLCIRVVGTRRFYNLPMIHCLFERVTRGGRVRSMIGAFTDLRKRPDSIAAAPGRSLFNHMFWFVSLLCIARASSNYVGWIKRFVVFPLPIFSYIFGVGTAAFHPFLSQLLGIAFGALISLFQGLCALSQLAGLSFVLGSALSGKLLALK